VQLAHVPAQNLVARRQARISRNDNVAWTRNGGYRPAVEIVWRKPVLNRGCHGASSGVCDSDALGRLNQGGRLAGPERAGVR
jgi:hypothetical protein